MAKGNLFQGMGRGKIGDVVFSRLNGQQVSRVRNRNPKNPRSNAQLYQRAIMATIMQAYSAGKKIFDHSFQGVAVGANNMAVFMRENLKILRQQIAYEISSEMLAENMQANTVWPGATQPVANAYLISKGNYKQKAFIETRPGGGIYYTLPEPETNEKVNEYAVRVGLLADDYYTFCLFLEGTNELFHAFEGLEDPAGIGYDCRFGYVRLHVKSNVASIEDAIATKSQLFDVDASMNIDETFMTENVAEGISMSDLDVTGRGVGSIGLIRSRKDRDLRSTSYMYCPTKAQQETNDFGIKAIYINEAWQRGTESLGNSDLILEGGGGAKPAPAPGPTPIPVEGDIQIFANPECTEYATGVVSKVYARINVPWSGLNSGWRVNGETSGNRINAWGPDGEDNWYSIIAWEDFFSSNVQNPYTEGEIVELSFEPHTQDVTNYTKVFSKP